MPLACHQHPRLRHRLARRPSGHEAQKVSSDCACDHGDDALIVPVSCVLCYQRHRVALGRESLQVPATTPHWGC